MTRFNALIFNKQHKEWRRQTHSLDCKTYSKKTCFPVVFEEPQGFVFSTNCNTFIQHWQYILCFSHFLHLYTLYVNKLCIILVLCVMVNLSNAYINTEKNLFRDTKCARDADGVSVSLMHCPNVTFSSLIYGCLVFPTVFSLLSLCHYHIPSFSHVVQYLYCILQIHTEFKTLRCPATSYVNYLLLDAVCGCKWFECYDE